MTKTYHVTTGGKLYLAGEYAVLTPGQTALIKYIPILMEATIQANPDYQLSSDLFDYSVDLYPDKQYALIQETVSIVNDYLVKLGHTLSPFRLRISGKFEKNGKKIGIGSSGSVIILTIKAMAEFYKIHLSADLLFRLASYVLLKRGDNGSMGDLACIAYEDFIAFTSFNRQKIRKLIAENELLTVLTADWGYQIRPIKVTLPCEFLVGWTGTPAISKDMIELVQASISSDFLEQTQIVVEQIEQGLKKADQELVSVGLKRAGQLLEKLHPAIYSKTLQELVGATKNFTAVAKSSGAGGGDCGVALTFDTKSSCCLIEKWQQAGIELLWQEVLA
ncbi:phosphomevalonate kinase [Streptococcus sp. sy004]|uniref:phosphomevalonate kinase n=1 Tax=Streptococcus sp. sy004 TaxID=2600149 RepID=UPI0011B6F8C3|nr:phosphomevalonate kinase [Streptococcus sp. sy004]TWT12298.1 phosphomevalonate kinase [Streptococcus sp. sy004]